MLRDYVLFDVVTLEIIECSDSPTALRALRQDVNQSRPVGSAICWVYSREVYQNMVQERQRAEQRARRNDTPF